VSFVLALVAGGVAAGRQGDLVVPERFDHQWL
jgi:hypothetical protein